MSQRRKAVDLLILAAVGFGPLVLAAGGVLLLLLLALLNLLLGGLTYTPRQLLDLLGLIALVLGGVLLSLWLGTALLNRAPGWWQRAGALYLAWLPLTLLLSYLLTLAISAFAGVGMAVNEGVATPVSAGQNLQILLQILGAGQAVMLPWVLLAAWLLPRLHPRWAGPSAASAPAVVSEHA